MSDNQVKPFPNYQEIQRSLPSAVWWVLRVVTFGLTLEIMYLIATDPETGMTLFWKLLIPSLPLLFAFAPGGWRQVCPMAFLNQLPRTLGISRELRLPIWAKNIAFLIATLSFFLLVSLRHLFFNTGSMSLIILISGALILALLGGYFFAGRSGWCGTFCPLAPIQKAYGHAPVFVERNGYCASCLGCQKNCYDFNPKAAFLADVTDKDPWYAGHKRFFVAALPGFAFAFFTAAPVQDTGLFVYFTHLFTWVAVSLGCFFLIRNLIRMSHFRASALAAMLAFVIFYAFTADGIITTAANLLSFSVPAFSEEVLQVFVCLVALRVLWNGYRSEKAYDAMQTGPASGGTSVNLSKVAVAKGVAAATVTERSSGRSFSADPDKSLLESIESAGLSTDFGCRMGMCGADPVVVIEGAEHLNPPSEAELATLRRLGLEGRARLACVCKAASGPVVIDLETDPHSLPEPTPAADTLDHAKEAGIKRVIVIGNGAAGSTIANELRRLGPSCAIDVIAKETHPFYNRMAIGRLLYEAQGIEDLYFTSQDAMAKRDITVHLNTVARSIDPVHKQITLGTGKVMPYDRLVLANGASAFAPPNLGMDKKGAFLLREAADAQAIRAWRQSGFAKNAMVLGGGVLGVEASDALRKLHLKTTLVQRSGRLMDRELDEKGSRILQRFLQRLGIDVVTNTSADEIIGEGHVTQVRLTNGNVIDTDIFLVCAGVRPNTKLAKDANLAVERGVIVDEKMQTSDPHILAVGDVAERTGMVSGLWTVGTAQAEIAAYSVYDLEKPSVPLPPLVSLKMEGIDVKAFGVKEAIGDIEEIADPNETDNIHRRLFIQNGKIVGAVFVGPPGTGKDAAAAIQSGADLSSIMGRLRNYDWQALGDL